MSALLIRILVAAVCVLILYAIIPAFLRIIGFPASGDVMLIIKVCIAGIAILYVIKGSPIPTV